MRRAKFRLRDARWPLALAALVCCAFLTPARGSLINSSVTLSYPQVGTGVPGTLTYEYDPNAGYGHLHMANTPYVLSVGGTGGDLSFDPNQVHVQTLDVNLGPDGQLVDVTGPAGSLSNAFHLYGTVTVGGKSYSDLLLSGTVQAIGSQDLGAVGIQGTDLFDAQMAITGGSLKDLFGPLAYLSFRADTGSTFTGRFDQSFAADSTHGLLLAVTPSPVPEPTTMLILGAGSLGVILRRRSRRG